MADASEPVSIYDQLRLFVPAIPRGLVSSMRRYPYTWVYFLANLASVVLWWVDSSCLYLVAENRFNRFPVSIVTFALSLLILVMFLFRAIFAFTLDERYAILWRPEWIWVLASTVTNIPLPWLGIHYPNFGFLAAGTIYIVITELIASHNQLQPRTAFQVIIAFILFVVVYIQVFAGAFFSIEANYLGPLKTEYTTGHINGFGSVYFALISITTIGYGDVYPTTTGSRVIVFFFNFVFWALSPIILAHFVWGITAAYNHFRGHGVRVKSGPFSFTPCSTPDITDSSTDEDVESETTDSLGASPIPCVEPLPEYDVDAAMACSPLKPPFHAVMLLLLQDETPLSETEQSDAVAKAISQLVLGSSCFSRMPPMLRFINVGSLGPPQFIQPSVRVLLLLPQLPSRQLQRFLRTRPFRTAVHTTTAEAFDAAALRRVGAGAIDTALISSPSMLSARVGSNAPMPASIVTAAGAVRRAVSSITSIFAIINSRSAEFCAQLRHFAVEPVCQSTLEAAVLLTAATTPGAGALLTILASPPLPPALRNDGFMRRLRHALLRGNAPLQQLSIYSSPVVLDTYMRGVQTSFFTLAIPSALIGCTVLQAAAAITRASLTPISPVTKRAQLKAIHRRIREATRLEPISPCCYRFSGLTARLNDQAVTYAPKRGLISTGWCSEVIGRRALDSPPSVLTLTAYYHRSELSLFHRRDYNMSLPQTPRGWSEGSVASLIGVKRGQRTHILDPTLRLRMGDYAIIIARGRLRAEVALRRAAWYIQAIESPSSLPSVNSSSTSSRISPTSSTQFPRINSIFPQAASFFASPAADSSFPRPSSTPLAQYTPTSAVCSFVTPSTSLSPLVFPPPGLSLDRPPAEPRESTSTPYFPATICPPDPSTPDPYSSCTPIVAVVGCPGALFTHVLAAAAYVRGVRVLPPQIWLDPSLPAAPLPCGGRLGDISHMLSCPVCARDSSRIAGAMSELVARVQRCCIPTAIIALASGAPSAALESDASVMMAQYAASTSFPTVPVISSLRSYVSLRTLSGPSFEFLVAPGKIPHSSHAPQLPDSADPARLLAPAVAAGFAVPCMLTAEIALQNARAPGALECFSALIGLRTQHARINGLKRGTNGEDTKVFMRPCLRLLPLSQIVSACEGRCVTTAMLACALSCCFLPPSACSLQSAFVGAVRAAVLGLSPSITMAQLIAIVHRPLSIASACDSTTRINSHRRYNDTLTEQQFSAVSPRVTFCCPSASVLVHAVDCALIAVSDEDQPLTLGTELTLTEQTIILAGQSRLLPQLAKTSDAAPGQLREQQQVDEYVASSPRELVQGGGHFVFTGGGLGFLMPNQ